MRAQFVDVVLVLAAGLLLGAICSAIWLSADGRYAVEPSLVTVATAPDSKPILFEGETP
jgi:hypothetical protein